MQRGVSAVYFHKISSTSIIFFVCFFLKLFDWNHMSLSGPQKSFYINTTFRPFLRTIFFKYFLSLPLPQKVECEDVMQCGIPAACVQNWLNSIHIFCPLSLQELQSALMSLSGAQKQTAQYHALFFSQSHFLQILPLSGHFSKCRRAGFMAVQRSISAASIQNWLTHVHVFCLFSLKTFQSRRMSLPGPSLRAIFYTYILSLPLSQNADGLVPWKYREASLPCAFKSILVALMLSVCFFSKTRDWRIMTLAVTRNEIERRYRRLCAFSAAAQKGTAVVQCSLSAFSHKYAT
jgi:hypothetical protein